MTTTPRRLAANRRNAATRGLEHWRAARAAMPARAAPLIEADPLETA